MLRRVIRNLLDSARRHGARPVSVRVGRAAGKAVLEVVDAGHGVPQAERDQVFTASAAKARAPGSAWRWCGKSRGCTAATPRSHRAPASRAVFA
jgi:signal transduction histidine kinase